MEQAGFSGFLGATLEGIREDAVNCLLWMGAVAGVYIVSDLFMNNENGLMLVGYIASIMVTLIGQSHLIRRYLERHHIASSDDLQRPRIGSIFGISLLTGVASLAGLLLLVIPGIFLACRWFASVPALFAEQSTATDAMRSSWSLTSGHVLAIFATLLFLSLPSFAGAASLFLSDVDQTLTLAGSLALNIPLAVSTVALWVAAAAIYTQLDGGLARRVDVFA